MPDFTEYDRGIAAREIPTVTVYARGLLSFSRAAFDELGKPEAVVFLFDREAKILGFRPAGKGDHNSYSVLLAGGRIVKHVYAVGVLRELSVSATPSRHYPLLTRDGVPSIDLSGPGTPVTRAQPHSKAHGK